MRIVLAVAAVSLSGCALVIPAAPEGATEPLPLVQVERSETIKARFGAADGITQVYPRLARFEDDLLRVALNPTERGISATVTNKSSSPIRLNWNESAFIGPDGLSSRVLHGGVRYINRNESMPPSVIPARATVQEVIVPSDRVSYSPGQNGGWQTSLLFRAADAGKRMGVLLTFEVNGEAVPYTFWLQVGASAPGSAADR